MSRRANRQIGRVLAVAGIAAGLFVAAVPAQAAQTEKPQVTLAKEKPTDAGLMHWSCGRAAPADLDTSGGHETTEAANMRVGSSTVCQKAGLSYPGQALDYHCYTLEIEGEYTWTYVVNVETKVGGWIRDDLLNDNGSFIQCPGDTNF